MPELPVIPGHRVIRLLGEGGMGSVYLAEDETLGRRVAIKIVGSRLAPDSDARARFLREARAMATVEHPHVVRVYSFGEAQGAAYFVMEYVEGESLSERLKRNGRQALPVAIDIACQVVEALEAAWEKQLVHRDIKPSNILLDARGRVHVADFGLAKPLHSGSDASLTASGAILGTPHYLSPEQARGQRIDFRSDVYSLGIVLYEMLSGRRPFEGATPFEIVGRHLHERVPSLALIRPELPAAAVQLVAWMTEKDPKGRPPDLGALRSALLAINASPDAVTAAPTSTMRGARTSKTSRRRWWLAVPVAAGLLAFTLWPAAPPSAPADKRLRVAVTPFYGPDEDSIKEGRVMAALVEKAITQRLRAQDVKVLGVEETQKPVRDHDAARALGERLGANAVVWGEAFALRGETQIQPYLTLVQEAARNSGASRRDDLQAIAEQAGGAAVMSAQATNQFELRKTSAAGVGDMVVALAGMHALRTEGKPDKALALFEQTPRTAEGLRYRAQALLELKRADDARAALEEATRLDPADAQAWGALGDAALRSDRFPQALAAYTRAASGKPVTHDGILHQSKLYVRETCRIWSKDDGALEDRDSGYLLAIDPASGTVVERHRLPGVLVSLRPDAANLEVRWREGNQEYQAEGEATLAAGRWSRPLSLGSGLLLRRPDCAQMLAANFLPVQPADEFRPRGKRSDVPAGFAELEAALGAAQQRDPTQPWYPLLLGQAAWSQGRRAQAEALWGALFDAAYPAIPYSDYAWMAGLFERLGQPAWADRAWAQALARRRALPQAIGLNTLIERLLSAHFMGDARAALEVRHDLDRAHLWFERAHELTGPTEGDALAAAAWEAYFHSQGDAEAAAREAAFRRAASASPTNFPIYGAAIDGALVDWFAALGASWGLLLWLLWSAHLRGARRSALFAALSSCERRAALLACGVGLVAFAPLAARVRVMADFSQAPVGMMDALDGDAVRAALERRMEAGPSPAMVFLRGVSHHLAGERKQAEELYASLDDPRARRNLEALRWRTWVAMLGSTAASMKESGLLSHWPRELIFSGLPAFQALLLLGLVMAFKALPSQAATASAAGRRYLLLLCTSYVITSAALTVVNEFGWILPGPASADTQNLLRAFPLPPTSAWTFSRAIPGAPTHVALLAVASVVALGLARRERTPAHQPVEDITLSSVK